MYLQISTKPVSSMFSTPSSSKIHVKCLHYNIPEVKLWTGLSSHVVAITRIQCLTGNMIGLIDVRSIQGAQLDLGKLQLTQRHAIFGSSACLSTKWA